MSNANYRYRSDKGIEELDREIEELERQAAADWDAQQVEEQEEIREKQEHVPERREEKSDAPLSKEEETFKKRYGDLRAHSQRKENELNKRIEALEARLNGGANDKQPLPKTREEVQAWMAKYPDVAGIVLSLIDDRSGGKSEELEARLRQIEAKEEDFKRQKAMDELKSLHPDFDDLVSANSELHTWAEGQPEWVNDILYGGEDPKAVGRILDLYKADAGIKTKPRQSDTQRAAKAVVTSPNGAKPKEHSQKRVFTEREIEEMSVEEFAALEDEIALAQREGRLQYNLKRAAY